jgi:CreA protein
LPFILIALTDPAAAQTIIDQIDTNFPWLGPNDQVLIERFDEAKVPDVSCYLSRTITGGVSGGFGFAENRSRFSVACRAVGPITILANVLKAELRATASTSLFFKIFQIHRAVDPEKNVLVHTVVSTQLINGSPFNCMVPVFQ